MQTTRGRSAYVTLNLACFIGLCALCFVAGFLVGEMQGADDYSEDLAVAKAQVEVLSKQVETLTMVRDPGGMKAMDEAFIATEPKAASLWATQPHSENLASKAARNGPPHLDKR